MTIGPLMIDVEGLTLNDEDIKRIMHPMVGGLILFTRNYKDTIQLKTLTDAIRKIRGHDFLIAVDHEGGRVQRFREGFTIIPAMRKLGEVWDKDPKRANHLAFLIGQIIATELRVFDIDFSFTPVLDIDYSESTVIRDRAFHGDIEAIKALASSLLEGLKDGGMHGVGKHFPGHGYIKTDSHLSISEDERTFDEIASKDMSIFIALIKHGLNAATSSSESTCIWPSWCRTMGLLSTWCCLPSFLSRPGSWSCLFYREIRCCLSWVLWRPRGPWICPR